MPKSRSLHVFKTIPKTLFCITTTQVKLYMQVYREFIHSCMSVFPDQRFPPFWKCKSAHINHAKLEAVHEDKYPCLAQACASNDNTHDKC